MKKHILNKKLIKLVCFAIFFALLSISEADAAMATTETGGLYAAYSKQNYASATTAFDKNGNTVTVTAKEGFLIDTRVENPYFADFDVELNNVIGRTAFTNVYWKGRFLIDDEDDYDFRIVADAADLYMYLAGTGYTSGGTSSLLQATNIHLEAGWHPIILEHYKKSTLQARAQLQFKRSSQPLSAYAMIPNDHLSPQFWNDAEVTIGDPADKLSYVTTGDGAEDTHDAEIIIQVPVADSVEFDAKVLKDQVFLFVFNKGLSKEPGDDKRIRIKNEITGADQTVDAIAINESTLRAMYRFVPESLVVPDAGGKLHLSFTKPSGAPFGHGVSLVVPFRDDTKAPGQIKFQLVYSSAWKSVSANMVFDLDDTVENTVEPVFFFGDGETKYNYLERIPPDQDNRPNHMYMAYGSGPKPGKYDLLRDFTGAEITLPKNPSASTVMNMNDPDTFFPSFGREGYRHDVISSNYVRNQAPSVSSQYISPTAQEGLIAGGVGYTIPAGAKWVAFQVVGRNYSSLYGLDAKNSGVLGVGESTVVCGGGAISAPAVAPPPPPTPRNLAVNFLGTGTGKVTRTLGTIDCPGTCSELVADGTPVTLTASPDSLNTFSGWSGVVCNANPDPKICEFTISANTNVTATFTEVVINGQCGYACHTAHCEIPTEGLCTPPSTVVGAPTPDGATKWEWDCAGINGGVVTTCEAKRQCGWVER